VSESGFTSRQHKKVIYGREKHRNRRNIRVSDVKVALRPGNTKRLYMDEKSTEIGEILE